MVEVMNIEKLLGEVETVAGNKTAQFSDQERQAVRELILDCALLDDVYPSNLKYTKYTLSADDLKKAKNKGPQGLSDQKLAQLLLDWKALEVISELVQGDNIPEAWLDELAAQGEKQLIADDVDVAACLERIRQRVTLEQTRNVAQPRIVGCVKVFVNKAKSLALAAGASLADRFEPDMHFAGLAGIGDDQLDAARNGIWAACDCLGQGNYKQAEIRLEKVRQISPQAVLASKAVVYLKNGESVEVQVDSSRAMVWLTTSQSGKKNYARLIKHGTGNVVCEARFRPVIGENGFRAELKVPKDGIYRVDIVAQGPGNGLQTGGRTLR